MAMGIFLHYLNICTAHHQYKVYAKVMQKEVYIVV